MESMDFRLKELFLGAIGVGVIFKGLDSFLKDKDIDLLAEDWNKDMRDVPTAIDFFVASEILKHNGNISNKDALNNVQAIITDSKYGFLNYERKETTELRMIIEKRIDYYKYYYNQEGSLALRREVEMLENRLLQVSKGEYKEYLKEVAFDAKLRGLMRLPNAEKYDKIRLRFAPNPNGPLSIGHSFGIITNNVYANAYDAEYILRYDDTDPDNKVPQAHLYEQIRDEFEFLTDRTSDDYTLYVASQNRNKYIN